MKNLKIKKLLAVAVAGILTVGLVACGSSNSDSAKSDTASGSDAASGSYRTLDEIKEDGTINIGVFSDKNPFGYVDENGDYQGYDVYFANRLAKDLGVKVNLTENYPDIPLQKFDSYATAKEAFQNGTSVAWANDNTEVIAFALQNKGYTVGISELGNKDTIAPAVTKGNDSLLEWINSEIETLGQENFFHKDYEETLVDTYGTDYEDSLVVEGGKTE